jgi:hypothetical protein
MRTLCALIALTLATGQSQSAMCQDVIAKVEYQAGHAGMDKRQKGSLVISDTTLRFVDEKGNTLITIPTARITSVSSSIDRKEASIGAKIALGFLAKSRKEELITVAYEAEQTAEGVIFKTEKNMSAGAVAKIQFHMKKAGVSPASDTTAVTVVPHPPESAVTGSPTSP